MSRTSTSAVVPWLEPDQLKDWKAVMALIMTLQAALDAQLKRDSDLNVFEYRMLAALSEAPGRTLPMGELAVVSQDRMSRLSHAVSRLQGDGSVERRVCSAAGRRTEVTLTDAGLRVIQQAAPGHVRAARELVVDALTPDQLRQLGAAARAVVRATDPVLGARLTRTEC